MARLKTGVVLMKTSLNNKVFIAGIILLVASIIIHYASLYIFNFIDHPYTLKAMRNTGSVQEYCRTIDISGACMGYYIYLWLFSNIPVQLSPILQVLVVILVYLTVYKLTRNHIVSGILALIYSLTPGVILAYSLDQTGLVYTASLVAITLLLLIRGFTGEQLFMVLGVLLYILLLLHPLTPVVLIATSITYLVVGETSKLRKTPLLLLIAMSTATLIAMIVNSVSYYGLYGVVGVVIGLISSLILLVSRGEIKPGYRVLISLSVIVIGVLMGLITSRLYEIEFTVLVENKSLVVLYGIASILSIPSVILVYAGKSSINIKHILVPAVVTLIISMFDQAVYVVALPVLVVLNSVFILTLVSQLQLAFQQYRKTPISILGVFILVLLVLTPGLIYAIPVSNTKTSIDRELQVLIVDKGFAVENYDEKTVLNEIASRIANYSQSNRVLIVAHWDYTYSLLSMLSSRGVDTQFITHTHGDHSSRKLLSTIMTSHWNTSLKIMREIANQTNTRDVYILVSFAYSKRGNDSFIGVAGTLNLPGYQYPQEAYYAYGDTYRILEYLHYANKTLSNYVYNVGLDDRLTALLWTSSGEELLLNQLVVKALIDTGYSRVYNRLININPLNPSIENVELIYYYDVKTGSIRTIYGEYEIHYMVAVFKLVA